MRDIIYCGKGYDDTELKTIINVLKLKDRFKIKAVDWLLDGELCTEIHDKYYDDEEVTEFSYYSNEGLSRVTSDENGYNKSVTYFDGTPIFEAYEYNNRAKYKITNEFFIGAKNQNPKGIGFYVSLQQIRELIWLINEERIKNKESRIFVPNVTKITDDDDESTEYLFLPVEYKGDWVDGRPREIKIYLSLDSYILLCQYSISIVTNHYYQDHEVSFTIFSNIGAINDSKILKLLINTKNYQEATSNTIQIYNLYIEDALEDRFTTSTTRNSDIVDEAIIVNKYSAKNGVYTQLLNCAVQDIGSTEPEFTSNSGTIRDFFNIPVRIKQKDYDIEEFGESVKLKEVVKGNNKEGE